MKQILRDVVEIIDGSGEIHRPEKAKVTIETEQGSKAVDNGLFVKIWQNSEIEKLGSMEIVFLVRIAKYLDHRDNTIRLNGEAMTVKEMSEVAEIGYARLTETIKGMIEKKVMGKHSTEETEYRGRRKVIYSVNPNVICKGRMIDKRIIEYYKP